jgi:hypothetical protein
MRIVLALCLLLLAACGTVAEVLTPDAPAAAPPTGSYWISIKDRIGLTPEEEVRLFEQVAARLGPAKASSGAPGAHELRITVTRYRVQERTGRASPGETADHAESVVQVIDPASGRMLREEHVLTRNQRVVGAIPLLEEHAEDIVAALR